MLEDPRFLRETVVDVDAAVVGVSSARWTYISADAASDEAARTMMQQHRFDVLPIVGDFGVKEYFSTLRWNDYSAVQRSHITHRDLLPLTTPLRDVIRGFAQESRHFYFLTVERRVGGLLSVANLNCRQVTVWLFSLLAELETELSGFVTRHIPDEVLLAEEFPGDKEGRAQEVCSRYQADRERGVDAPLVEYLYLSDLVNVVARRKLFDLLGYESRSRFESVFGPINELRNTAAHPVRSLVTDPDGCVRLWQTLQSIEETLFVLRAT